MAVLFTIGFVFWRFMEIITLIPTMGMLAYFVNGFVNANALTPNYILILFIVSVLALAWAIFTLFSYHRSSSNALFVAVIDLGFVGAFIAAVYYLRFIAGANCTSVSSSSYEVGFGPLGTFSGNGFSIDTNKWCAMLKACFAFGIMNCIFFFFTAVLAWFHGERVGKDTRYYRETHYSRRGHRRHSTGSRRSSRRRSSHSHRRVYV
ncbi:hypothetical protein KVR01_006505 [Diaporthe batatas]|uniref:uncharacterized protein n=1 Tax=Diaporthe batatas TaxID=748121 RepID=UPI001D040C08|nr:uncharacterized protein KVR01_006505 [Diaporthe batatas]KAG8163208.1 hypothetical protein KVR01_006505 [Diaporthe batatas]